jgi:hypothetical protein
MREPIPCFAAVVAASLTVLTAALAGAATDVPFQCETPHWTVNASGPFNVECPGGGECTQLQYQILPKNNVKIEHVALLVEQDIEVVVPGADNVYKACQGDPTTQLGKRDCSRSAVKLVPSAGEKSVYDLFGRGMKDVIATSIVIKKGAAFEPCRIASLGKENFDPNEQVTTTQEIVFKGCRVLIPTDPVTGEGAPATISGGACAFLANSVPVGNGELTVNGQNLGAITFGDGSVSSGENSCTTKVVNRKLYTWCTCTSATDPRPPCP